MTRYRQIVLRPGPLSPAGGRAARLTGDDLRRLRDNTLSLLAHGWRIPVLPRHAAPGADAGGPIPSPTGTGDLCPADVPRGATGYLVDLVQLADGSLAQVIEIEPIAGDEPIFTSPEIRPHWTDPAGRRSGPIIAHLALTGRPLGRGQTPLAPAAPREAFSFPLSQPGVVPMSKSNTPAAALAEANPPDERSLDERSDAPPREDVEFVEPEKPETDAANEDDDTVLDVEGDPPPANASPAPSPPPPPPTVDRAQLAQRIRSSRKLPKGLRDRLCAVVETLQLSDEADAVPRVPVAEAVEMIEAAMPENVLLAESALESPAHPHGENFFTGGGQRLTDADAQRIAAEQLAATGFAAPAP